ncbi:MAG: dockerin type I repeat-containing protein, partial [Planctomycetota bacterium]
MPRMLRHAFLFALLLSSVFVSRTEAQSRFTRSDVNDDGTINLTDAVCALEYLFSGRDTPCGTPTCLDAMDVNDDGALNLSDPVTTLQFLFLGGPPPAEPFAGRCEL